MMFFLILCLLCFDTSEVASIPFAQDSTKYSKHEPSTEILIRNVNLHHPTHSHNEKNIGVWSQKQLNENQRVESVNNVRDGAMVDGSPTSSSFFRPPQEMRNKVYDKNIPRLNTPIEIDKLKLNLNKELSEHTLPTHIFYLNTANEPLPLQPTLRRAPGLIVKDLSNPNLNTPLQHRVDSVDNERNIRNQVLSPTVSLPVETKPILQPPAGVRSQIRIPPDVQEYVNRKEKQVKQPMIQLFPKESEEERRIQRILSSSQIQQALGPKEQRKRYLAILPNGTVTSSNDINTLTQTYPNYVIVKEDKVVSSADIKKESTLKLKISTPLNSEVHTNSHVTIKENQTPVMGHNRKTNIAQNSIAGKLNDMAMKNQTHNNNKKSVEDISDNKKSVINTQTLPIRKTENVKPEIKGDELNTLSSKLKNQSKGVLNEHFQYDDTIKNKITNPESNEVFTDTKTSVANIETLSPITRIKHVEIENIVDDKYNSVASKNINQKTPIIDQPQYKKTIKNQITDTDSIRDITDTERHILDTQSLAPVTESVHGEPENIDDNKQDTVVSKIKKETTVFNDQSVYNNVIKQQSQNTSKKSIEDISDTKNPDLNTQTSSPTIQTVEKESKDIDDDDKPVLNTKTLTKTINRQSHINDNVVQNHTSLKNNKQGTQPQAYQSHSSNYQNQNITSESVEDTEETEKPKPDTEIPSLKTKNENIDFEMSNNDYQSTFTLKNKTIGNGNKSQQKTSNNQKESLNKKKILGANEEENETIRNNARTQTSSPKIQTVEKESTDIDDDDDKPHLNTKTLTKTINTPSHIDNYDVKNRTSFKNYKQGTPQQAYQPHSSNYQNKNIASESVEDTEETENIDSEMSNNDYQSTFILKNKTIVNGNKSQQKTSKNQKGSLNKKKILGANEEKNETISNNARTQTSSPPIQTVEKESTDIDDDDAKPHLNTKTLTKTMNTPSHIDNYDVQNRTSFKNYKQGNPQQAYQPHSSNYQNKNIASESVKDTEETENIDSEMSNNDYQSTFILKNKTIVNGNKSQQKTSKNQKGSLNKKKILGANEEKNETISNNARTQTSSPTIQTVEKESTDIDDDDDKPHLNTKTLTKTMNTPSHIDNYDVQNRTSFKNNKQGTQPQAYQSHSSNYQNQNIISESVEDTKETENVDSEISNNDYQSNFTLKNKTIGNGNKSQQKTSKCQKESLNKKKILGANEEENKTISNNARTSSATSTRNQDESSYLEFLTDNIKLCNIKQDVSTETPLKHADEKFWDKLIQASENLNVVYLFQFLSESYINRDTKRTIYPNGTIVEEITEVVEDDDCCDDCQKVTRTVQVKLPEEQHPKQTC